MRDRWTVILVGILLAAVPVGLWGASAFNPDDGWLVRSEPLWRVFGLYAYVGLFGGWLLGLVGLVALMLRRRRMRPTLN